MSTESLEKFSPYPDVLAASSPAVIGQLPAGGAGDEDPLDGVVQLVPGLL